MSLRGTHSWNILIFQSRTRAIELLRALMQFRVPVPSSEYPVSLRNATSRNNGRAHPNMCRFRSTIASLTEFLTMFLMIIRCYKRSTLQQYIFYYIFISNFIARNENRRSSLSRIVRTIPATNYRNNNLKYFQL